MANQPIDIQVKHQDTDLVITIRENDRNKQNRGCEFRFKAHEITTLEDFLSVLASASINMNKSLEQKL